MIYIKKRLLRAVSTLAAVCLLLVAFSLGGGTRTPPAVQAVKETGAAGGVRLPILMYHSMLPPSVATGTYILSPALFEQDLQYLQKEKYTTVTIETLLDYVNGRGTLPAKPIMLTFDDGYYNNYKYAFPLLKKYNMKMVLSPIGICTERFSTADADHITYSHVTWSELNEMLASGLVEVQNHTYNLHKSGKGARLGSSKLRSESTADYQKMLRADLTKMQDLVFQHTGVRMTAFTYPFGAVSEAAGPVVRLMGFEATMTCNSHVNTIVQDPSCLYGLGRFLRKPGVAPAQFFRETVKDEG